jgi:hypothetical protein
MPTNLAIDDALIEQARQIDHYATVLPIRRHEARTSAALDPSSVE